MRGLLLLNISFDISFEFKLKSSSNFITVTMVIKGANKQMSPVKRNVARLKDALWVEPRFQFLDENSKSALKFGIG